MVTFDALSADDMSLYGYRLPTTPNIDAFAQKASVFTNYFSCSTWTTPSVVSLQTGRYPFSTRVFQGLGRLRGESSEKTLVTELRAASYQTAASVANVYAFPPRLGLKFDVVLTPPVKGVLWTPPILIDDALFLQSFVRDSLEKGLPSIFANESRFPPERSFEQADKLLALLRPPYFLWVHVMAPHFPYSPSPPFLHRFLGRDEILNAAEISTLLDLPGRRYTPEQQPSIDKWRLRYDEWITEMDAAFGRFVARLEQTNGLDNTVLLVSADHGESFEGGVWAHGSPKQVRQLVHVPLIIRMPGQVQGQRISVAADHTAIAPTILDIAGLPRPEWMDGISIEQALKSDSGGASSGIAFTQFFDPETSIFEIPRHGTVGAIADQHQYVMDIQSGRGSLYHLAESNLQNNDISEVDPVRAQSMRNLILSRFPTIPWGGS